MRWSVIRRLVQNLQHPTISLGAAVVAVGGKGVPGFAISYPTINFRLKPSQRLGHCCRMRYVVDIGTAATRNTTQRLT